MATPSLVTITVPGGGSRTTGATWVTIEMTKPGSAEILKLTPAALVLLWEAVEDKSSAHGRFRLSCAYVIRTLIAALRH